MTGRERISNQSERRARQRRNTRVRLCFPVTVLVPEGDGRARVLRAHTVVVSHAGATLELDEPIPVEMGVQVTPPFGGSILAEVNDAWVEPATGRHRISLRLIDPVSWTSPERLLAPGAEASDRVGLEVHANIWRMLAEYALYMSDARNRAVTPAEAAEKILEDVFLSDEGFQDWFAARIMEDLESWQESAVLVS